MIAHRAACRAVRLMEWFVGKSFTVKPSALGRMEAKIASGLRERRIAQAMRRAGSEITGMLRAGSRSVRDLGGYQNGWYARALGSTLHVGNSAPNFIFVERGRKPGRPPPSSVLVPWVLRHGMQAGAAFPIAQAIGRRGIRARQFFLLNSTQGRMQRIIARHMSRWLDTVIKGAAG